MLISSKHGKSEGNGSSFIPLNVQGPFVILEID